MAEDPGRETRVIDIKGRQIVVRQLLDAQFGLMVREANAVKRAAEEHNGPRVIRGMDLLMRTLGSAIVEEEDRSWLDDLTAEGGAEMNDLLEVIRAFREEDAPAPPKVRRGRPAKRA